MPLVGDDQDVVVGTVVALLHVEVIGQEDRKVASLAKSHIVHHESVVGVVGRVGGTLQLTAVSSQGYYAPRGGTARLRQRQRCR